MIKLRLDVDYPYPSRPKSFLFTLINKRTNKDYLRNAKIIAKMVNESSKEVRTYWFFTPYTIPDQEMLKLMQPEKHEVALHVANHPFKEMLSLQEATKRKVNYYTIHGTERIFARLMWKRKIWQDRVPIPLDFPLKNFWDFPTYSLDRTCHSTPIEQAVRITQRSVDKNEVLHAHPEWVFQKGTFNHRGPYYETLRRILDVDKEFEGLIISRKGFTKIAQYSGTLEYETDQYPSEKFTDKLIDRKVDLYTFIERKWVHPLNGAKNWAKEEDNIALLHISSYDEWWNAIGKKTRNMVRKAEKSGVITTAIEPNETLAEGIFKIYNETPIRQGRAFSHYGAKLKDVIPGVLEAKNSTFIGAFFQQELIGFIQLVYGDGIAIIAQILSLQKHWDKAVNNSLIAKVVEICAQKKIKWVMYGRIGNHPSLDSFKQNNCFEKFTFSRYYVPLSKKGQLAIKLKLHRRLKDALPEVIKKPLFPVFNWVSRMKVRIRKK